MITSNNYCAIIQVNNKKNKAKIYLSSEFSVGRVVGWLGGSGTVEDGWVAAGLAAALTGGRGPGMGGHPAPPQARRCKCSQE